MVEGDGSAETFGKEMPKDMILEMIDGYVQEAKLLKSFGVDMFFLHCGYRMFTPSRFLSALTNKRTDEFGGSIENRAKVILMICQGIKDACGQDFPIEISMSGYELEGGNTLEEMIQFAKLAEGLVDVLQIRTPVIDPNHPIGLSPTPYPSLEIDRIYKDAGVKQKITAIGGLFQDFPAPVLAAVIDKDQLHSRKGLSLQGADTVLQVQRRIIHRNNHADSRLFSHAFCSLPLSGPLRLRSARHRGAWTSRNVHPITEKGA